MATNDRVNPAHPVKKRNAVASTWRFIVRFTISMLAEYLQIKQSFIDILCALDAHRGEIKIVYWLHKESYFLLIIDAGWPVASSTLNHNSLSG